MVWTLHRSRRRALPHRVCVNLERLYAKNGEGMEGDGERSWKLLTVPFEAGWPGIPRRIVRNYIESTLLQVNAEMRKMIV